MSTATRRSTIECKGASRGPHAQAAAILTLLLKSRLRCAVMATFGPREYLPTPAASLSEVIPPKVGGMAEIFPYSPV